MSPKKFTACLMIALFTGVVAGAGNFAQAGIIKWTDDSGKTHFTNDLSKIPRKFRDQGKMRSIRSTGTSQTPDSPAKSSSSKSKDKDILSKADLAKIQKAKAFLKKEMQFAKDGDTSYHTPTGLRAFGKKFSALNVERKNAKTMLEGSAVPSLQKVVAHIDATLSAAEENPNWMRKLSAANTIKRVKSEVSANPGLISVLETAEKKSEEKKKEQEQEKKAKEKPVKK